MTRDDTLLFSESNSRFIAEVSEKAGPAFERLLSGCVIGQAGQTIREPRLRIRGLAGRAKIDAPLSELEEVWRTGLSRLL